jgi:outer membrane protein TolC
MRQTTDQFLANGRCKFIATALAGFYLLSCTGAFAQPDQLQEITPPLPSPEKLQPADTLYYSEPETATAGPSMLVTRPKLEALITIDRGLDPFQLDATGTKQLQLADVVAAALINNLNIQEAAQDLRNSRWKLLNSYTQFLPTAHTSYLENYLHGHVRFPGSLGQPGLLSFNNPFILAQAGLKWNIIQGGKLIWTALQNKHNYRSTKLQYRATTNDVLLESSRRFYNLLLAEALLQIRIRAVQTSEEQLRNNTSLEQNGMATHLDVLQARTQLSDDRQNLIEQQISRRNAAIQLSDYLNIDQSVDLVPIDTVVHPVRLISETATPAKLLMAAMDNRPELRQFREQYLAARNGIPIAAAPMLPSLQLNASEYGIGQTLTNAHKTVLTPVTLPGGGTTLKSTTVGKQIVGLGILGFTINWDLPGLGLTTMTDIQSARAQARHAMLQSNQEANTVISQVRQAYLNQLSALRRSEESQDRVASSAEELRLAQLRLQSGLGKNIDVLRAQQDLTNALVQHAQATIDYNIAQVQLLHDLGLISRETVIATTPLKL